MLFMMLEGKSKEEIARIFTEYGEVICAIIDREFDGSPALAANGWRSDRATEKQLAYIAEMNEFSEFPLPKFTGTTKGEAADYINKWSKRAHESTWGIEHGY